ncbi:hypothetical protein FACS1894179_03550 [Bacteroidia bacterium]|nr:hypothetical protein FACS1894179_03550 [Bacteroidia bacterium]
MKDNNIDYEENIFYINRFGWKPSGKSSIVIRFGKDKCSSNYPAITSKLDIRKIRESYNQ